MEAGGPLAGAPELERGVAGRAIVVARGTDRIGRAVALLLSQRGARVVILGPDPAAVAGCVRELRDSGVEVGGIALDPADPDRFRRAFAEADRMLGGLHALVDHIELPVPRVLAEPGGEWARSLAEQLDRVVACAREALHRMRRAGSGHLVHVALDPRGSALRGVEAGLARDLAEALGAEVRPLGIQVSLVEVAAPPSCTRGPVPEDVAEAVYFCLTRSRRCEVLRMTLAPRA